MDTFEYNQNSFAKRLGVAPTVIYNLIKGRKNNPSFELINKILLSFDNINAAWLMLGTGEPISTTSESFISELGNMNVRKDKTDETSKFKTYAEKKPGESETLAVSEPEIGYAIKGLKNVKKAFEEMDQDMNQIIVHLGKALTSIQNKQSEIDKRLEALEKNQNKNDSE